MTETRIAATERLRREGRWAEASAYREEVRLTLRADKKPRTEANDAAWEAMVAKYPPLPLVEDPPEPDAVEDPTDFDALVDRFDDSPPDVSRDTLWAYANLENKRVEAAEAPSLGAWSLLKWAREHRNRFFEQMLPKAVAERKKHEAKEPGPGKDGEEPNALLKEMLRTNLAHYHRQWVQDVIANAPQMISRDVLKELASWQEQSHVSVSADACASLASDVIKLITKYVDLAKSDPDAFVTLEQQATA